MRRLDFEQLLCGAIAGRMLVQVKYYDDIAERLFQPEAVFHSTKNKVCVTGVQVINPASRWEDNEPRVFEVGKFYSISVTDTKFIWPARFDRFDAKYRNGIICSV